MTELPKMPLPKMLFPRPMSEIRRAVADGFPLGNADYCALAAQAYQDRMQLLKELDFLRDRIVSERERCAEACLQKVERPAGYNGRFEGYGGWMGSMTGEECAAAIRALPSPEEG